MAKPELLDHRKFLKLRRLLGEPAPHVLGYLEFLWRRGYQTGNPFVGDAADVEAAAEYPGELGRFASAAFESGFLEKDMAGNFIIHDLFEHAPSYAKKRMVRGGTAPNGVEWASVAKGDNRKMTPRGRKKAPAKISESDCNTVQADSDTVRADNFGLQASPHGQENGDFAPARTTKPKTENLSNTPLPPFRGVDACGDSQSSDPPPESETIVIAPFRDLVAAWNAAELPGHGKIHETGQRRSNFEYRQTHSKFWRENWRKGIERMGRSDRAKGKDPSNPEWTGIHLDTFLRDEQVLVRALEGLYGGSEEAPPEKPKYRSAIEDPAYANTFRNPNPPGVNPAKDLQATGGIAGLARRRAAEMAAKEAEAASS